MPYIPFTEEEKMKMTDEEKEHFIHPQQLSEEEKEALEMAMKSKDE